METNELLCGSCRHYWRKREDIGHCAIRYQSVTVGNSCKNHTAGRTDFEYIGQVACGPRNKNIMNGRSK